MSHQARVDKTDIALARIRERLDAVGLHLDLSSRMERYPVR